MGATFNTGYLENLILYNGSNNIGIGTSADATYKVTLGGSLLGTSALFSSSLTATQGKFSGSRPQGIFTENGTSGLYLRDATGSSYKSWSIGTNDIVVGFAITPSTAAGGTTFTTPAFVINESGNVGIGLTNPAAADFSKQSLDASGPIIARGSLYDHQTSATVMQYYNGESWIRAYGATAGSGILAFRTGGGGGSGDTERMRITSGGNVGIGVTEPVVQLNVGNKNHGLGFAYLDSSPLPAIAGLFTSTGAAGGYGYGDLLIKSRSDYGVYNIIFYTAAANNVPLERMRITSGGNVEVRRVLNIGLEFSATQYVSISENQIQRTGGGILYINNSNNGNVSININGGETFVNGTNGYGRAVTNSSDERIKKNIENIDNALSKLLQLNGVYYEFNQSNRLGISVPDYKKRIGLIAQQIETIVPELVFTPNEANMPKSVDYGGITGLIINAIKELKAEIEILKNK